LPYAPKTPQELRDALLRTLAAYLPQVPTTPGGFAYLEAAAIARIVADLHVRLDEQDRNATPLTASETGLAVWAELLDVPRGGASGSSRSQCLRVNGDAGAVIPANSTLTHRTGLQFEVPTAITLPASGTALADVRALSTGANTNLVAGEALRFDAAITDVSPAGRLELDLQGGTDEEPLGQWRARVVERFRIAIQGGTRSDYQAWSHEALPTVRFVPYPYPNKPTDGTVSIAGLRVGSGSTRSLTTAERDAIADYLETRRPITDQVVVMETVPTTVHVDLRIGVLPSAAFDWDDSPGYTVTSYNATTAQLVVSPNLPPELAPGHLLTVAKVTPGSSGADGHPSSVSAIVSTTTCVLAPFGGRSQPLAWTPSPGDPIYAYSLTADAVRNAVLSGYEIGCGSDAVPQPGMDTLGPANPGQVYGDWLADLERDRLAAAARSVAGVTDCTVVTPGSDQTATEYAFPDDDQVGYLVPGQVVVRSA
jgi:uncharacterized phage protein gp47/JayE